MLTDSSVTCRSQGDVELSRVTNVPRLSTNVVRLHTLKIAEDISGILRSNSVTRHTTRSPGSEVQLKTHPQYCSYCHFYPKQTVLPAAKSTLNES